MYNNIYNIYVSNYNFIKNQFTNKNNNNNNHSISLIFKSAIKVAPKIKKRIFYHFYFEILNSSTIISVVAI